MRIPSQWFVVTMIALIACAKLDMSLEFAEDPEHATFVSALQGMVFVGSCNITNNPRGEFYCFDLYYTPANFEAQMRYQQPRELIAGCIGGDRNFSSTQKCSSAEAFGRCELTMATQTAIAGSVVTYWYNRTQDHSLGEKQCMVVGRQPNYGSKWFDM